MTPNDQNKKQSEIIKVPLIRKRWLWVVYFSFMLLLRGYVSLEEHYFPTDTECSLYKRIFGSPCIFAVENKYSRPAFFTADGKSIVYTENKELRIEPIAVGDSIFSGESFEHPYRIWNIAMSPDRSKVITCIGKEDDLSIFEYWIWEIKQGSPTKKIDALQYGCAFGMHSRMEFSGDGKYLILNLSNFERTNQKMFINSDAGQIGVVDLSTGALVMKITGDTFAVSPNENYLIVQNNENIKLLQYLTLESVRNFDVPDQDNTYDLSISMDGKYLIGNDFENLYVWDTSNGKLMSEFSQFKGSGCRTAFTPITGDMFSCFRENWADGPTYETYVLMWGPGWLISSGAPLQLEQIIKLGSRGVLPYSLDVSPDGKNLLIVDDDYIQIFEIPEVRFQ